MSENNVLSWCNFSLLSVVTVYLQFSLPSCMHGNQNHPTAYPKMTNAYLENCLCIFFTPNQCLVIIPLFWKECIYTMSLMYSCTSLSIIPWQFEQWNLCIIMLNIKFMLQCCRWLSKHFVAKTGKANMQLLTVVVIYESPYSLLMNISIKWLAHFLLKTF